MSAPPPAPSQPSEPHDPPAPPWGAAGWALVLLAFAVGFVGFPLRVLGPALDHLPGDPADDRLNNYVLEHGYRYLSGRAPSFWDAPMFYPRAGATRTSDAHLGMLPFYAAMRAGGASPEGAFQGYFLLMFALNFASAAWAVRRLRFGPVAAAVGAYVFAFGLPVAGQLAHVQLYPRFLVPPAAVLALEFLRGPKLWRAWAVVGCAVGQAYLSIYIGYFLGLMLAAGFVAAALVRGGVAWRELAGDRRAWAGRALAVGVGAVAVLPLPLNHSRGDIPKLRDKVAAIAPRPSAWLNPPTVAAALPAVAPVNRLSTYRWDEQQLLPGALTLLALPLGMAAVWRGRSDPRRVTAAVAAWTAVAVAVLVTRIDPVWLYDPLADLPGTGGIRAIGRVVLVLLFPAGLVLGAVAEAAAGAAGARRRRLGAAVALLAVAAVAVDHRLTPTTGPQGETWIRLRTSKDDVRRQQASVAAAIRAHPAPKLVYVFPPHSDRYLFAVNPRTGDPQLVYEFPKNSSDLVAVLGVQCAAMRASQDAGLPCVNGWSGHLPRGWDFFPTYRELFAWLEANRVPADVVAGLVVVGEPLPDADPVYEAAMRAKYPPRPMADVNP